MRCASRPAGADLEPVYRYDTTLNPPRFVAVPLDPGPAGDLVVLVLYGTGVRFRSGITA